eukprot:TCALIF_12450-PB protein Name:"Protein of unknown function" AED:0.56 eAED:0.83 QI:0/1/0/1/0/0.5/2/0/89
MSVAVYFGIKCFVVVALLRGFLAETLKEPLQNSTGSKRDGKGLMSFEADILQHSTYSIFNFSLVFVSNCPISERPVLNRSNSEWNLLHT